MTDHFEIRKSEVRRFILMHHGLYPPRQYFGEKGILGFIEKVGSIQFDPINIVGRNPDLVLQSRVKNYQPKLLDDLLYKKRSLVDGWDKMASIYSTTDWPYFVKRRMLMSTPGVDSRRPPEGTLANVLDNIRNRGPLSSLDFDDNSIVDWHWGPTKQIRAALESLNSMSKIGVHHRISNRRYFDITEKLMPEELLSMEDPFQNDTAYQEWHILRRIGSMGLVNSKSGGHWLGIIGVKSKERNLIIQRLCDKGLLFRISIREIPNRVFFLRHQDKNNLENALDIPSKNPSAAIIAPLDNLIWNRGMIRELFDFEYVWEVYKPKSKRDFGYYVLPILMGDRFIARFEPKFDKKLRIFTIENWWWESSVNPNTNMIDVLGCCFKDFCTYLKAEMICLGNSIKNENSLQWILGIL